MFTKCQNKERKRGWNCQRASILIRICFSKKILPVWDNFYLYFFATWNEEIMKRHKATNLPHRWSLSREKKHRWRPPTKNIFQKTFFAQNFESQKVESSKYFEFAEPSFFTSLNIRKLATRQKVVLKNHNFRNLLTSSCVNGVTHERRLSDPVWPIC